MSQERAIEILISIVAPKFNEDKYCFPKTGESLARYFDFSDSGDIELALEGIKTVENFDKVCLDVLSDFMENL